METEAKCSRRIFPWGGALLLEGGKRLEEFGQVDVRVAAGCQSFVGHVLQPAVHLFFSFPVLHTIWERREGEKTGVSNANRLTVFLI